MLRKRERLARLAPYLILALGVYGLAGCGSQTADDSEATGQVPIFELDPTWPHIPNDWVLGQVASVATDSQGHIWLLHRPRGVSAEDASRAAPPVLEFDVDGNYVAGWGGSHEGYDWPESEHGLFVDSKGNVWIGGNAEKVDNQILKFTRDGSFLLQIGHKGKSQGNSDTENLNRPADVFVHERTNEVFVADGYANRRVIVFDADTGAFKRMWGAFGNTPAELPTPAADATEANQPDGLPQFDLVHGVAISNDDLVYVSDRAGKRVQLFTLDGKFVDQVFIDRDCVAPECGNGQTTASTAFSTDPEQKFMFVASRSRGRVWVMDRKSLKFLYSFGQMGRGPGEFNILHHMAVDQQGNLYTTEVEPNRRAQKFVYKGMADAPAN